jgi:CPA2 family monovalent cation:H+ antiporter-2
VHDLPLLVNVAAALAYAAAGGLLAQRLRLPPIVGYLLAGVAIGPFTPGFVGHTETLRQLAELGVVFLMFGVGLHFSLQDLWTVREVAVPGTLVHMGAVTAAGYALGRALDWSPPAALVLGVAVSVASTVVLVRALMDRGLLDTPHGKVALGRVVCEDLATVAILVLLPLLTARPGGGGLQAALLGVGKAALFVVLMLVVGRRVVPWVLDRVVHARAREIFVVVAFTLTVGTALASAAWFGVSLALGAFLAGVVVRESRYRHQVDADILPFREVFSVLFFVSVGMLVNPAYLAAHWREVAALSALVVVGKTCIAALTGFLFARQARTALVVAAGLSQIGEFSFIVGQAGLSLGILDASQYPLILAGALVSITVNPLVFRLVAPVEHALRRRPRLWRVLDRPGPQPPSPPATLRDHVVIVGAGRVGGHLAEVLGRLEVPHLVVESDPSIVGARIAAGMPVLFGDAANSDILRHANLAQARALVVTLPDETAAAIVVVTARHEAPSLFVLSRAATREGASELLALGAQEIVHPEMEGGIQVLRRTLLALGFPLRTVQAYADAVRRQEFGRAGGGSESHRVLEHLVRAARDLELGWATVSPASEVAGQSLAAANLRGRSGASVIAIARGEGLISNPDPQVTLQPGDHVAVLGTPTQVEAMEALLQP